MTIRATDNLSLLASLAPLRQTSDNISAQQDRGFSDRLDKAISAEMPGATTAEKARAMAESLTLQMLQTSLSLSGDGTVDSSPQPLSNAPLPSFNSLIQAYRSNLPESLEQHATTSIPTSSRIQEQPAVATPQQESRSSQTGTSWLDPIIAKASRRYGVDVGLIKAVIKAESNFNPQAISHAGARGLMQLMPATARSLGVNDSFDPVQNVMAGTRFLSDMLQRYNGDIDSALAAYNWGPGNVDKRPDRLPRETRDYQAKVKQLYASYNG